MNTAHTDFNAFGLPEALIQDLTRLGFSTPTPIQVAGIPVAMEKKDLLAIAPTGTGKTAAFSIPALANLATQNEKQALIIAPTRELAAQIFQFINQVALNRKVKGALLVGGESFGRQFRDWNHGVDYIVATPGRLMDHVGRGLDLKHVGILILDEIDRMLDMGFAPQIEEIVGKIPKERQTLFFSATMPPEIQRLAERYLNAPVKITVAKTKEHAPKIVEEKIQAAGSDKEDALLEQVKSRTGKIIIFTRTQMGTDYVAEGLESHGIEAARLHGGRTQAERKLALDAFRRGRVRVLVATDIAARGIDVADVEVVINYDRAANKEDHLHRIGRTGRCGKEGLAITFNEPLRRNGSRFQTRSFPSRRPERRFEEPREPREFRDPRKFEKPQEAVQENPEQKPKQFDRQFDRPWTPRPQRTHREGYSGSVRFFREGYTQNTPMKGRRKPGAVAAPVVKPKQITVQDVEALVRSQSGVVRRRKRS